MSSVRTPRLSSTSNSAGPKSSPTGPTGRTSVKKLAASEKWTAAPPSMRSRSPNGVRDGVEGDRSDHGQRHADGSLARALRDFAAGEGDPDRGVRRARGARARRGRRPRARRRRGPGRRRPQRHQLRRHPRDPQRLPRRAGAAADPRRRDQRPHRRRAPGRRAARRPAATPRRSPCPRRAGPGPRRGRRRPGGGAAAPGADRDGAGRPLRADRGRRDDRGRGGRRRHRLALRPARQAGRREGDRPRLQRGEARPGRAARRRRHRRLARRGPQGGDPRGQRRRAGRRGPPHERRRRLRRRVRGARAARPHGRLRDRLARAARGLDRGAAARLEGGDRLLARPPAGPPRAGGADDRRAARRGRRRRARGDGRRRLPALGGGPRPRGPDRPAHHRQAALDPSNDDHLQGPRALAPAIQQALDELGFEEPTPIQEQAIPELLAATT